MIARFCTATAVGLLLAGCTQLTTMQSPFSANAASSRGLTPGLDDPEDARVLQGDFISRGSSLPEQSSRSPEAAGATSAEKSNIVATELNLGHIEAGRNNVTEAKRHYQRALEQQPDQADAHHRLAIIADKEGDYATAEHHYLTALEGSPGNVDLLSDLGYSYFLQRRFRESQNALEQALRLNPSHSRALNNLGLVCATQNDYDGALAVFRRAGSETEAQSKIAQLFPQGKPFGVPPPIDPQQNALLAAGAAQSMPGDLVAAGQAGQFPPIDSSREPNELTRKIRQEMDRERVEAAAHRARAQQAALGALPPDRTLAKLDTRSADRDTAAPRSAAVANHGEVKSPAIDFRSPKVPDSQINQALASIDASRNSAFGLPSRGTPQAAVAGSPAPMDARGQAAFAMNGQRLATASPAAASGALRHAGPSQALASWNGQTAVLQPSTPAQAGMQPVASNARSGGVQSPSAPANVGNRYESPAGQLAVTSPPVANSNSDASRAAALMAMDGGVFPLLADQMPPQLPGTFPSGGLYTGGSQYPTPQAFPGSQPHAADISALIQQTQHQTPGQLGQRYSVPPTGWSSQSMPPASQQAGLGGAGGIAPSMPIGSPASTIGTADVYRQLQQQIAINNSQLAALQRQIQEQEVQARSAVQPHMPSNAQTAAPAIQGQVYQQVRRY